MTAAEMPTDLPVELPEQSPPLAYNPTSFSQGRMDFSWEELSEEERRQAYADWEAGKGLIGGDPRQRPGSHLLPEWGLNQPFFRAVALEDARGDNGERLAALLASRRPLEVEIGYGRGDFLLDRAIRHRELFLLATKPRPRPRACAQRIERAQAKAGLSMANLWLSDDDARFNLPRVVPTAVWISSTSSSRTPGGSRNTSTSVSSRRLLWTCLRPSCGPAALLHFKSDVQEYGELVRYLVDESRRFCRRRRR